MISKQELNPNNCKLSPEQEVNFEQLYLVMNEIRSYYGKPMIVTSGVRSWNSHVDIYVRNGAIEFNPIDGSIKVRRGRKFPTKSAHLDGAACDISDPQGLLAGWCKANLDFLAELGVYVEDPSVTKGWCHFQVYSPSSGNRIFIP